MRYVLYSMFFLANQYSALQNDIFTNKKCMKNMFTHLADINSQTIVLALQFECLVILKINQHSLPPI